MEIFNEKFWIDQWNNLNEGRSSQSGWSNAAVWNSMAENYGGKDKSWLEQRRTDVKQLLNRSIIFPGAKVLDIGCGPGSHGIPFAEAGCKVTAVDISEKMIERFKSEIPQELKDSIDCHICNWHDINPEAEGFLGEFDLVFANMTPAINSAEDLKRLMQCSKRWCHWAGWSGERRDYLMEDIRSALDIGHKGAFEGNGLFVFNLLCSMGYTPQCDFTSREWERQESAEKLTDQATAILTSESGTDQEEIREKIREYIVTCEKSGFVQRKSKGTSISMQWKILKTEETL